MIARTSDAIVHPGERDIAITRLFDAPRTLVWRAWASPEHLSRWWGPLGFSTTTHEFAFEAGRAWKFTMHGPDGTDYPNFMRYEEISPPERIVYALSKHAGDPPLFRSTVTFASEGAATRVTMRAVFASVEVRDALIASNQAVEGGKQTLARLGDRVIDLAARPSYVDGELYARRVFDAPCELVYKAWTTAEGLSRWIAPDGFAITECRVDCRAGGELFFVMEGMGMRAPFRGRFDEVVPNQRIAFTGAIREAPGHDAHTVVTFEADGERTILTLSQRHTFEGPETRGAPIGWGQSLDHLAAFVRR